jgi:ATP-dependent DNA helicase RecQ
VTYRQERALQLLRLGTGIPNAVFRDGQEDAIRFIVERRGRLLVVQRTGWGKSSVYFIATKLLREAGGGPALLVSPLLSLMRNQLMAAERMGVRAATINSENVTDWAPIEQAIARNEIDILIVSPERFANDRFKERILGLIASRVSLLVVDEAHCISDWGHDFRPHYRLLERVARSLPRNLPLLATTATANSRVMSDLQQVLGPDLNVSVGNLARSSLTLQTMRLPDQSERLAWLAEHVPQLHGSGIIYTLTVRDAKQVTAWLQSRGLVVETYTGQSNGREELERALLENKVKALVATQALGMGFDKPDLGFVIHFQAPGSVVAYYQQVGRAGRAVSSAYGVLLGGSEDTDINEFFVESAFPTREEVDAVLQALEGAPDGLSVPDLLERINVSKGRTEKAIALLSLESPAPIVKDGTKWTLTAAPLQDSFWERAQRLTELRREEQQQMQNYVDLEQGHMEFLIFALDGKYTEPSSRTQRAPLPTMPRADLVREAVSFLRRSTLPIEARKRWPDGGLPRYGLAGNIRQSDRAQDGFALSVWGDAGWGRLVKQGKYETGRFDDALVDACATLVRGWQPQPPLTWVTCIPSSRYPLLVSDFASRLAIRLGLQFSPALLKTETRPEQKTMENSTQQARNVDGSLAVDRHRILPGSVLLVDDMVDSRWTLTVAACLLRRADAGEVFPLALAVTGGGE